MRDSIGGAGGEAGNRCRSPHGVRLRLGCARRRCDPIDTAPLVNSNVSSMRLQGIDFDQVEREAREATQQFDDHLDDLSAWHGLRRLNRPRAEDATALSARLASIVLASDAVDRRRGIDRARLQRDCERVA